MSATANDKSPSELTTTISLSSLREVPNTADTDSLLSSLPQEISQLLGSVDSHSAMLIALNGAGAGARFLLDSDHIL